MKLEIKNLRKTFNNEKIVALDNLSLSIPIGTSFGVLGRNGAGKTTIIRILLQIYGKDSGSILYDGRDIFKEKIRIGYLPEERGIYLKITVKEQLKYFGKLKGLSGKQAEINAKKWLERLGISEYYNRKVEELSKGNKQKVQLITALIDNPEIIILDEPFSGLDPVNVELFKLVFKELLEQKKTIIFSSHRIDDVEEFCDNVVLLNKGKIVDYGTVSEIKNKFGKKILTLETDKEICGILNDLELEHEKVNSSYKITLDNAYNIGHLIENIVREKILINKISVDQVSLNKIFIEKLS